MTNSKKSNSENGRFFKLAISLIVIFIALDNCPNANAQETKDPSQMEMELDSIVVQTEHSIWKSIAQETKTNTAWKFETVSFSSGKTPLTSGLTGSAGFSRGKKNYFSVLLNNDLAQLFYTRTLTKNIGLNFSAGTFFNVPWYGPAITTNWIINPVTEKPLITTMHWLGWSVGIPEEGITSIKKEKMIFLFNYHEFALHLGMWDISYVYQVYEKNDPNHLYGVKRNFSLGEQTIFFGVNLMIPPTGIEDRSLLWNLGVKF